MNVHAYIPRIPETAIDVVEAGRQPRKGRRAFDLERDIRFSTAGLQSYAFARWEPVVHDAMILAAAVEYADRSTKRPALGWTRKIELRIPVHEPDRWSSPTVIEALHEALRFLTGDDWSIEFSHRKSAARAPSQEYLQLPIETEAVIAYSDGMDSRAVAGILNVSLGERLVRVRVGSKASGRPAKEKREPFTRVPYSVSATGEASARNRGFKFALISGLAAYLTEADQIIIPESGQGIFGPALITAAHAYPDFRNHPLFTARMEKFMKALLRHPVRFVFPRLWHTKGETLREFTALPDSDSWRDTKSCWRGAQWSALNGKLLQCGICAACMLRRMSINAARLSETGEGYICSDLTAPTFEASVQEGFTRMSPAFREYAIAGTLHLDHLADMADQDNRPTVARHAALTAAALDMAPAVAEERLRGMLQRHAAEWNSFLKSIGARSFLRQWTRADQ
ncbi:7-cyano-7-deazaguanine synthase [Microvirga splendida]|uniref:7-cyano-7-deazaguanine synthase n=1 Tax=Microvirga splendida TaxID=2795727 RepID=A0ABS0Y3M6_9HYPH|nr:7-cyano-7-deazaguanine synthase [Microvirga splendida]MBJ6126886.1 7-cyano-7-deazaguanine synthase [Microvirga splendida]